jgi:hypothetical protein
MKTIVYTSYGQTPSRKRNIYIYDRGMLRLSFSIIQARYQTHIAFLTEQIDALQTEIEHSSARLGLGDSHSFPAQHPRYRSDYRRVVDGRHPEFNTRQTAEQLVAFAGLAPYPLQSGTTLNRTRGVGRGGHIRLRSAFYMAATASLRSNAVIRRLYHHPRQCGKPAKVALCACARKLVLLAWAVVTKHQSFAPDFEKNPMALLDKNCRIYRFFDPAPRVRVLLVSIHKRFIKMYTIA